ncbi:MAG: monothiol glutaredoxin, Grx4 family [Bdellovibrio sp. CG12_big_fil_rev_8_21_14_0_65_39_13]|nr:MAG: monothiol glutaredoxin, Grx4 family [Bdellovibrio sp. CG22_combo_CG10-13_8_21_14_all_39_27]PIQ62415.1 MAG: monothiol glutaredoxin, Grx4 family [Bdellovibrio sp. CG12_big_fil_rev_8_21_14_0_65_39_13]PIR34082.1 MAG: monothiol glutaredoxin, Grx4 family [Bdellovibrio sp. CG11_big_fil_rev_8_21_14_0_20_39_38]PJB52976.1 MAG: monothiol glutaredoxin, Grx4 family [Bdellovibrio sp. CG_4_9_14_3_um_filter_39_7]
MNKNPFNIINSDAPSVKGEAVTERDADKSLEITLRIKNLISSSDIFLFMKGVPEAPMCGFSANVIGILQQMNVPFKTFNILEDYDLRDAIKAYSNWPTYPQLYFRQKLIGGNDIVTELYESGELEELFKS